VVPTEVHLGNLIFNLCQCFQLSNMLLEL